MSSHEWPAQLGAGVKAPAIFGKSPMQEIYNRWAEHPAYLLYRVIRYITEKKGQQLCLKSFGHICYLWGQQENGRCHAQRYLLELEFKDDLLLIRLLAPAETVPLEHVELFGQEADIPVHRVDEPLPDHPAAAWYMGIVRQLETPPPLDVTAQVSKEIARGYIWGVCEELARSLEKIAGLRGQPFPRPLEDLEAELTQYNERFGQMDASTGMARLNIQAEIVCVAAQILLQKYSPCAELQLPWMTLLNCFGQGDHATAIQAARIKVALLAAHPELACLPNDSGFSLRGPMHAVEMAIREALRLGVYK